MPAWVVALAAGGAMLIALVLSAKIVGQISENPCDRYRDGVESGALLGISKLNEFERSYLACTDWLIDHPDRVVDYESLP